MTAPFFDRILRDLDRSRPCRVAIPMAQDEACAYAVGRALEMGILAVTLIGDPDRIRALYGPAAASPRATVLAEGEPAKACQRAVRAVRAGEADILMKGLVPTATLLKAVLHSQDGLKKNPLLSHLVFFESANVPGVKVMTDAAINIAPDQAALTHIVENAWEAYSLFETRAPRIGLLSANEKVSDKVSSTVLARQVSQGFADRPGAVVEGPVSLDIAVSPESAGIKKYPGRIQGNADIFVVPRLEAGNAFYKALHYFAGAAMGGVVYGARCPIVLTSRADDNATKFNSLLLGIVLWQLDSRGRATPAAAEVGR